MFHKFFLQVVNFNFMGLAVSVQVRQLLFELWHKTVIVICELGAAVPRSDWVYAIKQSQTDVLTKVSGFIIYFRMSGFSRICYLYDTSVNPSYISLAVNTFKIEKEYSNYLLGNRA